MAPETMLAFDLDGVVTDPETGSFNDEVLQVIAADLAKGFPVAFITGRALDWVDEHVAGKLSDICNHDDLSKLLIVAENGGVTMFQEKGRRRLEVDRQLSPPQIFKDEAKTLLERDQGGWSFSDTMFWDKDKQTMSTVEKIPGVTQADFVAVQPKLAESLRELLKARSLDDFRVNMTTIATDIEHVTASKQLGATKILAWLNEHGIKPKKFEVFGDSPSDSYIAGVFARAGKTKFIYVGDPAKLGEPADSSYDVIVTGGGYDADTARYLKRA